MSARRRTIHKPSRGRASAALAAYTLVEMMVVVAITGVLTALAIPAYTGYTNRGRASEAVTFLGVIKLREEHFRSEFGAYTGSGAQLAAFDASDTWAPQMAMSGTNQIPWVTNPTFTALGAKPDGATRFAFGVIAGTPNDGSTFLPNAPYNVPAAELDFYFIARSQGNLDGDTVDYICEVTSFQRNVWCGKCSRGTGASCTNDDKGWE